MFFLFDVSVLEEEASVGDGDGIRRESFRGRAWSRRSLGCLLRLLVLGPVGALRQHGFLLLLGLLCLLLLRSLLGPPPGQLGLLFLLGLGSLLPGLPGFLLLLVLLRHCSTLLSSQPISEVGSSVGS